MQCGTNRCLHLLHEPCNTSAVAYVCVHAVLALSRLLLLLLLLLADPLS
jgi:hypothetical protein